MFSYEVVLAVLLLTGTAHATDAKDGNQHTIIEDIIKEKHLKKEGFIEFSTARIHEKLPGLATKSPVTPDYLHRRRRSADTQNTLQLELQVFNTTLDLSVKHNVNILTSKTPVFVRYSDRREVWKGDKQDCYLEGTTARRGVVSLSYCHGLTGSVIEGDTMYRIDPVGPLQAGLEELVLVSRGPLTTEIPGGIDIPLLSDIKNSTDTFHHRSRRQIPATSFTIELGLYVDAFFYSYLETAYIATTTDKKINMLVLKWNAVQAMMDLMLPDLGYTVTLQIKSVEFWQTDPLWFSLDVDNMSPTLASFCDGMAARTDVLPTDIYFLHTGSDPNRGLAYNPGQCGGTRCALETGNNFYRGYLPAHEIGHTLGMNHDDVGGCMRPDSGIMEWSGKYDDLWSTCNKLDIDAFLATSRASCLFEENVSPSLVDAAISNIVLPPGEWPGMAATLDDYCEQVAGPGWRYRDWYSDWGVCSWHNCINLNPGPTYGTMIWQTYKPAGTPCADGSICKGADCVTYEDARFDVTKLNVIQGGWTEWSTLSGCSRTCGTGTRVKKRTCTNPKPRSAPPCQGSAFYGEICNTDPCPDDASDTIINLRAGEVCSKFVADGVLSNTEYDGTGTRYYANGDAQCEVKCNLVAGVTIADDNKVRYGLMSNGVGCGLSSGTFNDMIGYPRGHGVYGSCVEGYCEGFSKCTDSTSGIIQDLCGVCGGDNSTCTPVDGVFTGDLPLETHVEFVTLPAGTSNVLFYFDWKVMKDIFVEIFDTSGKILLSSLFTFDYDLRSTPKTVAGADWYFLWYKQYLYTFGTLTSDIVIKFYNQNGNPNTGITYGYSLPSAATQAPTTEPPSTVSPTTLLPGVTTTTTVTSQVVTSTTTTGASTTTMGASQTTTDAGTSTHNQTLQACDGGFIACGDGHCIWYTDVCNGIDDCGDNSDENNALCGAGVIYRVSLLWLCFLVILHLVF